jgi:hypothetical protein
VADRTPEPLTPPADPWSGTAPVLQSTSVLPSGEPYVIVVQRPRRRRWPWVVGGLALLSVLCLVAAAIVWAPIGREYPAHLDLGDQVAGLSRTDNPDYRLASAEMVAKMYHDYGVDDAVATVLTDSAKQRLVILVGATKLILNPGGDLNQAIHRVAGDRLHDVTQYPALGGHLTCANATDDKNQPVVVCAWADHGSIGLLFCYGPWPMSECATTLNDIRTAIVRRASR